MAFQYTELQTETYQYTTLMQKSSKTKGERMKNCLQHKIPKRVHYERVLKFTLAYISQVLFMFHMKLWLW